MNTNPTIQRNQVILVDEHDRDLGVEDKLRAHQNGGQLHRAFSIFIFNSRGELLLQQRAQTKYHFPGLWTNTCCSHPVPGSALLDDAAQRLREEMGFITPLKRLFTFIYKATDPHSGLTEHELDHVLLGFHDQDPDPNPAEAADFRWSSPQSIAGSLVTHPQQYTPWFYIAFSQMVAKGALPPV